MDMWHVDVCDMTWQTWSVSYHGTHLRTLRRIRLCSNDSFIMRDISYWYVWHDSLIFVTWFIDMCDILICATRPVTELLNHLVRTVGAPRRKHLNYVYKWVTSQIAYEACYTFELSLAYYNTRQHTSTLCNTLQHWNTLQHTATRHPALQHTAIRCNSPEVPDWRCLTYVSWSS